MQDPGYLPCTAVVSGRCGNDAVGCDLPRRYPGDQGNGLSGKGFHLVIRQGTGERSVHGSLFHTDLFPLLWYLFSAARGSLICCRCMELVYTFQGWVTGLQPSLSSRLQPRAKTIAPAVGNRYVTRVYPVTRPAGYRAETIANVLVHLE